MENGEIFCDAGELSGNHASLWRYGDYYLVDCRKCL